MQRFPLSSPVVACTRVLGEQLWAEHLESAVSGRSEWDNAEFLRSADVFVKAWVNDFKTPSSFLLPGPQTEITDPDFCCTQCSLQNQILGANSSTHGLPPLSSYLWFEIGFLRSSQHISRCNIQVHQCLPEGGTIPGLALPGAKWTNTQAWDKVNSASLSSPSKRVSH